MREGEELYGHGMVWNRDLPGEAGRLRLGFDLRADLGSGSGLGTAADPTRPHWNLHFAIGSIARERRPRGEVRYTMAGSVTAARDPDLVGAPVRIVAETKGDTTAIAIGLGPWAFGGAGIVIEESYGALVALLYRILRR